MSNIPAVSGKKMIKALKKANFSVKGVAVVAHGKRRFVDPHWQRGSSYLKIGWNWIKSALNKGWRLGC